MCGFFLHAVQRKRFGAGAGLTGHATTLSGQDAPSK
jgi:hypothetical protein